MPAEGYSVRQCCRLASVHLRDVWLLAHAVVPSPGVSNWLCWEPCSYGAAVADSAHCPT